MWFEFILMLTGAVSMLMLNFLTVLVRAKGEHARLRHTQGAEGRGTERHSLLCVCVCVCVCVTSDFPEDQMDHVEVSCVLLPFSFFLSRLFSCCFYLL